MSQFAAARSQCEQIEAARKILKPSPVKLGKIPQWMKRRLKHLKTPEFSWPDVISHVSDNCFLDHWGTAIWNNEEVFVTEPYPYGFDSEYAREFAEALGDGVRWQLLANSWHYPGATLRVIFGERPDDPEPEPEPEQ